MEYVFAKDEGNRGMKEKSDGELRSELLCGWSCGKKAMDSYFEVFDLAKVGIVKELNRNPVDCDECW